MFCRYYFPHFFSINLFTLINFFKKIVLFLLTAKVSKSGCLIHKIENIENNSIENKKSIKTHIYFFTN